ncbi:hypothetical protein [Saccharothrix sp. ST-888]|uniref:hypothetical protein n=1 Tax=Saccharothrix sp. ST-888 TaxID=1427391 RepID=UPI0005ECA4E7|nr:hypothetical protein [Saccharothrix sp. ST-888]KJK55635.1 hypothetical protein UK12_27315 [Saccharothrix sp. ST-888]
MVSQIPLLRALMQALDRRSQGDLARSAVSWVPPLSGTGASCWVMYSHFHDKQLASLVAMLTLTVLRALRRRPPQYRPCTCACVGK